MRGRHRAPRSRAPLIALAVLVAAAVGGAGYVYRDRIREVFGADATPAASPAASPAVSPGSTPATPSPTPSPTPTRTAPPKGKLVIHGTGDVNLDPSYIPSFQSQGYGYAWSGLDGLFRKDDLTVVNLECAVSDLGNPVPKEFNFRGDPEALPAMREAGVEVANLGNNHAYDYGPEALVDTRRNLIRNDIDPVGAGRNSEQALEPALFRIKGWKIAVLGFDLVVDPYPEAVAGPGHPGTAAGHDTDLMVRTIRETEGKADLVVVSIHWGIELETEPNAETVALGRRFVDAGADVVFGHHSHRLQPFDTLKGTAVFWGLGNFVWPNFSVEGSETGVARVVVRPNGGIRARLIPAFIEDSGHPVLTR